MMLIEDLKRVLDEEQGIISIGYDTKSYFLANSLSEFLLNSVTKKEIHHDVSYLKSLKLINSVFVLDTVNIVNPNPNLSNFKQNSDIIKNLSIKSYENKSSIILMSPVYYDLSNGGHNFKYSQSISYSSIFVGVFIDKKLKIKKCRWNDPNSYSDKDLVQFFRDIKIDSLLS